MLAQEKLQAQLRASQTWNKPTALAQVGDEIQIPFTPVMLVADREVLADGRVRLLVKPVSASYSEEWIVEKEAALDLVQNDIEEVEHPAGFAGDSVSCNLVVTNWYAVAEYESGVAHGKLDAANQMPPICTEATCPYSQGYLTGYNDILASKPQQETIAPPQWSITWNPTWQWYEIWVGNAHAGRVSNYEEAERIAQKYLAAEELRRQHRELVLAAFAS